MKEKKNIYLLSKQMSTSTHNKNLRPM